MPGCIGGSSDTSFTDYCIDPNTNPVTLMPTSTPHAPTPAIPLVGYGGNPSPDRFPLQRCEGDCDVDSDVRYIRIYNLVFFGVFSRILLLLCQSFSVTLALSVSNEGLVSLSLAV